MEIKVLSLGHIHVNCYLISTDSAAVVIDPGFNSDEVTDFLLKSSDKARLILLTHAHFDHIGAAKSLRELTNTEIAIGKLDNLDLSDTERNLSDKFHARLEPFSADILLSDKEEITVGDLSFRVLHTPGHTVGGVSYLLGDILFSGDTLFNRSIGRTDFPGGDYGVLMNSVEELFTLPEETVVLSGHGEKTTIGFEKKYNPFINF